MASVLKVDKLDPQSGTALEIGTSGDTVTVPTGAGLTVTDEVKTNKVSPATGTAFALGDSGDTFTVPSGATLDISASTLTPPATMPASSGINFTALNATNLGSGTVPTARLGSGTASSTTILYGDQTYKTEPSAQIVFLGKSSTGTTVSELDVDTVFSSTYTKYLVVWENVRCTGATFDVIILPLISGSSAGSVNSYAVIGARHAGTVFDWTAAGADHIMVADEVKGAAGCYANGMMWVYNPQSSTDGIGSYTFNAQFTTDASGAKAAGIIGGGNWGDAAAKTGVRITGDGEDIYNGAIYVYGVLPNA